MNAVTALATRDVRVRIAQPRLVAGGVSLGLLGLLLVLRLGAPGWPMDEGAILAYAGRILAGDVPGRDLHSFYGPLSSYLVAGVFKVAGPSVEVERAIGIAYRLLLAGSLLSLVRRRGWGAVLVAGALLAYLLPAQGDAAFAVYGGLAFAALALALADLEQPLPAGLAAGAALLMRFDFALPVLLAGVPFLVGWPRRSAARLVGGAAVVVALYVPFLAVLGSGKAHMWVRQLVAGQSGRSLPLPAWSSDTGRLLLLGVAAIVLCALHGWRRRRSSEGRMLLSVALFASGLLPYALLRPDRAHVLVAALVPVAVLPALRWRVLVSVGCVVAVAAAAAQGTQALLSLDVISSAVDASRAHAVVHDGRSFPLSDPVVAANAERAVALADRLAPAGGRLFVGPRDLRRTTYSDAYMYFLLPRLRPATFYITLDPGATDAPGARLADEIGSASVLVLNTAYDDSFERNARAEAYGTAAPNRVVARRFCLRGAYGTFRVLTRCR